MNKTTVSLIAMLICTGVLALAAVFGYVRYKSARAHDAAFSSALRSIPATSQVGARMPAELVNPGEGRASQGHDAEKVGGSRQTEAADR